MARCLAALACALLLVGCATTERTELRPAAPGFERAGDGAPWTWTAAASGITVEIDAVLPQTGASLNGRIVNASTVPATAVFEDEPRRPPQEIGRRWVAVVRGGRIDVVPIVAGVPFEVPGSSEGPLALQFELWSVQDATQVMPTTPDGAHLRIALTSSGRTETCTLRFRVVATGSGPATASSDLAWWHPVAAVVLLPVYLVARVFGDPLH